MLHCSDRGCLVPNKESVFRKIHLCIFDCVVIHIDSRKNNWQQCNRKNSSTILRFDKDYCARMEFLHYSLYLYKLGHRSNNHMCSHCNPTNLYIQHYFDMDWTGFRKESAFHSQLQSNQQHRHRCNLNYLLYSNKLQNFDTGQNHKVYCPQFHNFDRSIRSHKHNYNFLNLKKNHRYKYLSKKSFH